MFGLATLVFAVSRSLWLSIAALAVLGAADMVSVFVRQSLVQIVTPDEIGDPYPLAMEARVKGEVWSRGRSEGMLFSFEEMIAYMSRDETLFAGEFIGSGTVGNGCGLEHGRYLQHGDTIELEVERIGVLMNKIERQS